MRKLILKLLQFIVFFGLAVVMLYLVFKDMSWESIRSGLMQANYYWLPAPLIFAFGAIFIRSHRWRLLMEPMGYYPSLSSVYHAVNIGYLANFAFPRLGEVSRCYSLKRSDNVPFDKLFGTVIIERVCDLLIFVLLIASMFFVNYQLFGGFLIDHGSTKINNTFQSIKTLSPIVLGLCGIFVFLGLGILYVLRHKLSKHTVVIKIKQFISGLIEGLKSVVFMKRRVEFLIYTLLLWICYYFMTYTFFFCFPLTSSLSMAAALFLLVIGTFAFTAPVQGGFGLFHILIAAALSLYGITTDTGKVFAIIMHESQFFFMVLLGFISYLIIFVFTKQKSAQTELKDGQVHNNN